MRVCAASLCPSPRGRRCFSAKAIFLPRDESAALDIYRRGSIVLTKVISSPGGSEPGLEIGETLALTRQKTDLGKFRRPDNVRSARSVPRHSPKLMRGKPGVSQKPRRMISSPSSRKARCSPLGSWIGLAPRWVISRREPCEPGFGPEMVPLARRSPSIRLQPLLVWWAIIWGNVHRGRGDCRCLGGREVVRLRASLRWRGGLRR